MTQSFIAAILLTLVSNVQAQAKPYFELAYEAGGASITGSDQGGINAGGGIKLVAGIQNEVGKNGQRLSVALGYLFDGGGERKESDQTTYSYYEPPEYEFSTVTMDVIYTMGNDLHRFGIGGTYHLGPSYNDNVRPLAIDFDDAPGLVLQYTRAVWKKYRLGTRITIMNYKANNLNVDASSFGIFISGGY